MQGAIQVLCFLLFAFFYLYFAVNVVHYCCLMFILHDRVSLNRKSYRFWNSLQAAVLPETDVCILMQCSN